MPDPSLLVGQLYPDLIRNTPNLIGYWRMRDQNGAVMRDELGLVNGVYGGGPALGVASPISGGAAARFLVQYATIAKDLSAYALLSVSFWLWWDAYSGGDNMAMEYTPNANNASGFWVDPSSSSAGGTVFGLKNGLVAAGWGDYFTRPSAAAWHHYLVTFDRTTPVSSVIVDGRAQTLTTDGHTAGTYGNFANSTLYLMSRNTASLFGNGKMTELALFGGRILTQNDAATQYNVGIGR